MAGPQQPACLDRDQLCALLEERLPEVMQSSITAHLDTCDACRESLERLAAESLWWKEARDLGDSAAGETSHHETAAFTPSGAAREASPGSSAGPRPQADYASALPFLEPTDRPRRLGLFGPYEVIEVVGRGGMGVLLKAFDPSLHRVVAIKVMAPQLAAGTAARQRFVREARAAASVCHENVVTIHSVDEHRGWPYLVMQYVGGKSLQDRIDHSGTLDVKEILRIGMQTASGLAAAHEQGLVHRDIKPANILLENGVERVKITDFGLARAVDDPSLTQAGVVAGTPQYMSPEQARCEVIDERSDLFSLGAVIYAMATGRPPFRGDTTIGVLRRVCDENPRPIRDSNADVPGWLESIVTKLLSKDPQRRYQSAAEVSALLADRLASLQNGRPIAGTEFDLPAEVDEPKASKATIPAPVAVEDVGPQKRIPWLRRWRAAAAVGIIGLLGLGVTEAMGVTKVAQVFSSILRITTPEGTLVVEVDDPEVQVSVDDGDVMLTGGGVKEIRLKPGIHKVRSFGEGWLGPIEMITVERGGKQTIRVGLEHPRLPAEHPLAQGLAVPEFGRDLRVEFEAVGTQRIAMQRARELLRSAIAVKEAAVDEADIVVEHAKAVLERASKLVEKGVLPVGEREEAEAAVRVAEGNEQIARAEAELAKCRFEVSEAMEELADARQEVLGAQIRAESRGGEIDERSKERLEAARSRLGEAIAALGKARVSHAQEVVGLRSNELEASEQARARVQQLFEKGVIPASEVESKVAIVAQARARLKAAEAALSGADRTSDSSADLEELIEGRVDVGFQPFDMIMGHPDGFDFKVVKRLEHIESDARAKALRDQMEGLRETLEKVGRVTRKPDRDPMVRNIRAQLENLEKQLREQQVQAGKQRRSRERLIIEAVPVPPPIEAPIPPVVPVPPSADVAPIPPSAPSAR
jgi:serine/threonine protein kinase